MNLELNNSQDCFVLLWRRLERTRRLLGGQCKRYCIRNILPSLYPLKHRELLRAVVAVRLGISFYKKVNLKALDAAYSEAFPNSTPINKNKKGKRLTL
ncbi:hypothetical protein [uncultured Prevotella sp.]|uniref:hypothetical protein n=1 Tax=uncultured Prevotella sp. TaxID=159272 RepID=UPI00258532D1|nr:hypothetical protein [uncultured Prevotella sp.]